MLKIILLWWWDSQSEWSVHCSRM